MDFRANEIRKSIIESINEEVLKLEDVSMQKSLLSSPEVGMTTRRFVNVTRTDDSPI